MQREAEMLLACLLGRRAGTRGWDGVNEVGGGMPYSWERVSARLPRSSRVRFLLDKPTSGRRGPLVSFSVESLGECLFLSIA